MLQKLPGDEGVEDGWNRASALFDTLRPDELLQWPAETLLTRLVHEEGVRLLVDKPLRFACPCSQGQVADILPTHGRDHARTAGLAGRTTARCTFWDPNRSTCCREQ